MKRKLLFTALMVTGLAGNLCLADSSQEYLEKAKAHMEKSDYKAAVIELRNSLQEDKNNAAARLMLARAYQKTNNPLGAEKELRKVRKLGVDRSAWARPMGEIFLQLGQPQKILDEVKVEPRDSDTLKADLLALRGIAHFLTGDSQQGAEDLEQALTLEPGHAKANLYLATVYEKMPGKSGEVSPHLEAALKAAPDDDNIWLAQARWLLKNREYEKADEALDKALELNSQNFMARIVQANLDLNLGRKQAAEEHIEFLAGKNANNPLVAFLNGKQAFLEKDFGNAESLLLEAVTKMPKHPESNMLLGMLKFRSKDWQQAVLYLERAHLAIPTHNHITNMLGQAYLKGLGQPQKAIELWETALKNSPGDPQVMVRLANAYMGLEDYDKANELMQQAIEINPEVKGLHAGLALVQLQQGEMEKAVAELQTATEDSENLAMADLLLVSAYLKDENPQKAESTARELAEKFPDNALAQNMLGAVLMMKQEMDEASEYFKKARKLDKDYMMPKINLARVENFRGNTDKAMGYLKEANRAAPDSTTPMLALAEMYRRQQNKADAREWLEKAWNADKSAQTAKGIINFYLAEGKILEAMATANELVAAKPDSGSSYYLVGITQSANNNSSSAITNFRKAVQLDPKDSRYYLALEAELIKTGELEEAMQVVEELQSVYPDSQKFKAEKIGLMIRNKQWDEAIPLAVKLRDDNPESFVGYNLEGDARYAAGDDEGSRTAYKKALELGAGSKVAVRLAQIEAAGGNQEEAVKTLEKFVENSESDVDARFYLASFYQQMGRDDDALKTYREVLDKRPKHVLALNNTAWLLMEKGDAKAVDYADQAAATGVKAASVLDTIGWVYTQFDDARKGLGYLQDAMSAKSDFDAAKYHAAVAYHKLGRKNEAKSLLEEVVKSDAEFDGKQEAVALLKEL